MRDKWYGDNRDLVKWGVLLELSERFGCKEILQILYYRALTLKIGKETVPLRWEVVEHFRNVKAISGLRCSPRIKLLDDEFGDRTVYRRAIEACLQSMEEGPAVVFLDPDTGLEPESQKHDLTHVRAIEIQEIWKLLRSGDVMVFYQHQDNRNGSEWIERKRVQFARALEIDDPLGQRVKLAHAPEIAKDVAFYFIRRD